MARMEYCVKVLDADGKYEYKQISGKEFYALVNSDEGKKRRFVRLVGSKSEDLPTIMIEATDDQYREWRKEYDDSRRLKQSGKHCEVSYERIRFCLDDPEGGIDPLECVIGMEVADRIREVYRELGEKDKIIFKYRFMYSPRMSISAISKEVGVNRKTVSRRVKRIQ